MAALAPLSESALEPLIKRSYCRTYTQEEEVDLETGEGGRSVLGVVEGQLQLWFRSAEGKEMPVSELCGGVVCGFGPEGWAAPDETVLKVISPEAVVWLALPEDFNTAVGSVAAVLFCQGQDWLRELGGLASDGMHKPAARICYTLWRDARHQADDSVAYTHEHLAARSCTQRSKATRVVGQLRREGAVDVRYHPRRIVVVDPDRLTEE